MFADILLILKLIPFKVHNKSLVLSISVRQERFSFAANQPKHYFTVTVTSFDPHGVLKVMVNVPVCLLIEVTEKTSMLLPPASFPGSGKAAMADQSLLLAVTLSAEIAPSSVSMIFAEPPLLIVISFSLREMLQLASPTRRGRCEVLLDDDAAGGAA
jgi:hypothetical protein